MALTVYLKSGGTTYTLTNEVAYRVLASSLPNLVWELEGETLNEISAGDITLTCENVTGWWDTWAASLNHTTRYPTAWYVEIYKESVLRWDGDVDVASVSFDTKGKTCSFTVRGKLSRLERYNAEDVKRAIPSHFDFGYGTAAAAVVTDVTKNWVVNSLANHCLIDDTDACFTIASNTATAITVSAGAPSTGYYRVRPYAFKLSVAGHNHTFADADVEAHLADTITVTGHGMLAGDAVEYYTSAGHVVTGLTDHTVYWVILHDADNIQLALTKDLADAGTEITGLAPPAGGDTHYLVHNDEGANALRQADGGPTSTIALLARGDSIRITRQGATPYRTVASKPGVVYARTIYPEWNFDFEDVEIEYAGPRVNTLAPQVTLDADQVLIDQVYEEPLGHSDAYYLLTPYYRNTSIEDLVRKLFVSCSLTENEDFVIYIPRFYGSQTIPYADFSGKTVADALAELAALSGCMLYSTGRQWIFAPRDLERPGARDIDQTHTIDYKEITSDMVTEDTECPMWEHSYDYVSVKDGQDREVRRGRYVANGAGLEIETDYELTYPLMRAVANRSLGIFGGRRIYREIGVTVDGGASRNIDHGWFLGPKDDPIGWTQYNTGGVDASAPWSTDAGSHCNITPDDGSKWYILSHDDAGARRHVDIYVDVRLPVVAWADTYILACIPDSTLASGWALKITNEGGAQGIRICEFTSAGTLTQRASYAFGVIEGDWYTMRLYVNGYEIKGKVWHSGVGDAEPADWQVEYTAVTKTTTGAVGLAVYTTGGTYEFANFYMVGVGDYELGYNIGDRILYDSAYWWVVGIDEPIRAYTYGDIVKLKMISERVYDAPHTWAELNGTTAYFRLGAGTTCTESEVDNANDEVDAGGHGFTTGMPVAYILTGGTGITGLTTETVYYAIRMNDDSFALASTQALAIAGTKLPIAPPGAGAHTYAFYESRCNPTASFSVAFWLQVDSAVWNPDEIVLCKASEGGTTGFAISTINIWGVDPTLKLRATLRGITFNDATPYVDSDGITTAQLVAGIHVCIAVDAVNKQAIVWINGTSSLTQKSFSVAGGSVTASAYPFTIGNWADLPADHYWAGRLRDVQVWDKALTDDEATRLMYAPYPGTEAYLSGRWKADEGYGPLLRDSTPYACNMVGFDTQWELPANDASVTAAKPEPPTILYYYVSTTDEMVVDTNLPSDRLFGFYFRTWPSTGNSTVPENEGFVPQGDAEPYWSGWPLGATKSVVVPGRYVLFLPGTYTGDNIDVAVVSYDGHMSDPSEPFIVRQSHPV